MKPELENKIFQDFSVFFLEHEGNIECRDGWFNLIYETLKKIHDINKSVKIFRIKEKLGALRIYARTEKDKNNNWEKIIDIIDLSEIKSKKICEICGEIGSLINFHGWLKTICLTCLHNLEHERTVKDDAG